VRTIRLATPADAAAIASIYGPAVRDTPISFEVEPPDAEAMATRIASTLEVAPWLVCEEAGEVLGYAYGCRHRDREAYRWCADVSVYVREGLQRSGVGRALYGALLPLLALQGFRAAHAGITLPNPASVGLHEAVGFRLVGVYPKVGWKLGAWHDVGWWQLELGDRTAPPETLRTLAEVRGDPRWAAALAGRGPAAPLARPLSALDLTPAAFTRLGHRAVALVADDLARLQAAEPPPVRRPVDAAARARVLEQPLPAAPVDPEEILRRFDEEVRPFPMGNGHPRFFGWVNSPAQPVSVLAELLAAGMNPSAAGGDHAATYLEHAVLRWLLELLGLDPASGAILCSGGSVANLIGLAAMRHRARPAAREAGLAGGPQLVVYGTAEGHSCLQKAVELLGLGRAGLRQVATDGHRRMDVEALQRAVEEDRRAGRTPAAVAASAGTVNTGAVDPLDAIADVCEAEGLWFHVDGAYGGFGSLAAQTGGHRGLFRGLARADSVAVDPHKWLSVPVECGCAIVRNKRLMRDAFSLVPPYLRDDAALPWFSEFGIQQTRGFRALKLWMALQAVGADGYRREVSRQLELARALAARVRARPGLELLTDGPLSVVTFRVRRPGAEPGDEDGLQRAVAERVQSGGRAFLTSTMLDGRTVLRACLVNFRTVEADLDALLDAVEAA
jgi:glutamate/tyrosine decarboxylase-like PLP-dependent enzyme/L-amino acid N-acyltransferase YncA